MHLREGDERVHHAREDPLLQESQHYLGADQDFEEAAEEEAVLRGVHLVG